MEKNEIMKIDINIIIQIASFFGAIFTLKRYIVDFITKDIRQKVMLLEMQILKMNIQLLIYNQPNKVQVILELYKQYKDLGGNSYIDLLIKEWQEEFAIHTIDERIKGDKNV